jgi:dipeptidyl aminopeptidase/acylaminoacyl peptidase
VLDLVYYHERSVDEVAEIRWYSSKHSENADVLRAQAHGEPARGSRFGSALTPPAGRPPADSAHLIRRTLGLPPRAAFSPDGSRIVTASYDSTARIWDAASAKEIAVLRGHENAVTSAAFSPDGSRIVTASWDRTARIWDAASAREIAVLRGHDSDVTSAAFSPSRAR